jgi:DnaJ-class molecular chaperone
MRAARNQSSCWPLEMMHPCDTLPSGLVAIDAGWESNVPGTRITEKVSCLECCGRGEFKTVTKPAREYQREATCQVCRGLGRVRLAVCSTCNGDGKVTEQVLEVEEAVVRVCDNCGGEGYLVQVVEIIARGTTQAIVWMCDACGGAGGFFEGEAIRGTTPYVKCRRCRGLGKKMGPPEPRVDKRVIQPPSRLND